MWVIEIIITILSTLPIVIFAMLIMMMRNFTLVVSRINLNIHIHVLNRCLVDVLIWLLLHRGAALLLCDYQI